jgi:hypothetical protein
MRFAHDAQVIPVMSSSMTLLMAGIEAVGSVRELTGVLPTPGR